MRVHREIIRDFVSEMRLPSRRTPWEIANCSSIRSSVIICNGERNRVDEKALVYMYIAIARIVHHRNRKDRPLDRSRIAIRRHDPQKNQDFIDRISYRSVT